MTVDREALLGKRHTTSTGFAEEDVEIPGLGTIRVRGLSRFEVLVIQKANDKGPAVLEQMLVSMGSVDPVLSDADVKQWQRVSVGEELEPVTAAIMRLSGMSGRPDKQAALDFEADPGSEFRILPGPEAGDDGSQAADGNEQ